MLVMNGVTEAQAAEDTSVHVVTIRTFRKRIPLHATASGFCLRRHVNLLCNITEECCWDEGEMREAIWRVVLNKEATTTVLDETLLRT